ncbi:MAG: hypothetical protein Q4D16_26200 [Eubacteriales bacterium]|nr:hypothetical protein [Eubacteriales bacterium]
MNREEQHLIECLRKIKTNIHRLEIQLQAAENESQELFRAVRSGDTELYSQLMVSINMKNHYEKSLHKNRTALDKPYFGRIDYKELDSGQNEKLYIGKNGITMGDHEVTVVDWRAPAATIYYENPMGKGSYQAIDEAPIPIDLHLKRTFDIGEGKLLGYYDSDVAANDELLVKYLSQNKEAVLGDIISTIQKEQNEIIRETPYADILVQGVAGSGKTTVAMHRISYILYNYGKHFAPEEFCIIAASDMLLRYITSGLPELDVENVRQMTMVHFLIQLLSNEWKKNYEYIEPDPGECCKSHISFIKALDKYLGDIRIKVIPHQDITDTDAGILMYGSDIREILDRNPEKSVSALCSFLNERLISRIRMLLSEEDQKDLKTAMLKKHKKFFTWKKNTKAVQVYIDFLFSYAEEQSCPTCMDSIIAHVQKGRFDVYDLARHDAYLYPPSFPGKM